jgi:hypothetical protein
MRIFQNGLIVMDDLSKLKIQFLFFKWSYYNGQPVQVKTTKTFQNDLTVLGDPPR